MNTPLGKRGTVYLADSGGFQVHRWTGYWDDEPDGPPSLLEQGPGWDSVREAIGWAQERSDRILIRLDAVSGYWWVGSWPAPNNLSVEGVIQIEH